MPRGVGSSAGEPADGLSNYLVLWIVLFSVTVPGLVGRARVRACRRFLDGGRGLGPIDEKIQCQLMVRFNNYFGLAVAVLVARDDPLYGPFERGRQKLSFLVCYRPLAKARRKQC